MREVGMPTHMPPPVTMPLPSTSWQGQAQCCPWSMVKLNKRKNFQERQYRTLHSSKEMHSQMSTPGSHSLSFQYTFALSFLNGTFYDTRKGFD